MNLQRLPFERIVRHYQTINRIISFGLDGLWRQRTIGALDLREGHRLLDVGVGTGDMLADVPHTGMIKMGVDPERTMMDGADISYHRVVGTAERLPFVTGAFDRLTAAFSVRNFTDRIRAFGEFYRIIATGGKGTILEMSPPDNHLIGYAASWYIRTIVPAVGGWISGDQPAYEYLSRSVMNFPSPDVIVRELESSGFVDITAERLAGWVAVLYRFVRP